MLSGGGVDPEVYNRKMNTTSLGKRLMGEVQSGLIRYPLKVYRR